MKVLVTILCGLVICASLVIAQPLGPEDVLVQELILLVTNGEHVYSLPLETGVPFYARISGTYGYANGAPWMDAAYCYQGPVQGCEPAQPDTGGLDADWFWNGLRNQRPTPDEYNLDHVYYFMFMGNGLAQDFYFYEPNSWDFVDNVGQLQIQIYRDLPRCPPTPLPFVDNFDSPELDSCWTWIREDTSHWSLTERPGWMRIVTQAGTMFESSDAHNLLLRPRPIGDFEMSCSLEIAPTENYQGAGVIIYNNDGEFVKLTRHYSTENIISFQGSLTNGPNIWIPDDANNLQLRLRLRGNLLTGEWTTNGVDWSYAGECSFGWLSQSELRVGMLAINGNQDGLDASETPADFDYFRIDPLPGTTVCGDVSGVWDSTGSPYYVTCDVTVPAGQTLEIQPGVDVLFTGHYKFNVFGNLQAIGTEQDSIVFTRAFPTEESKWWGIRFYDSASDSSVIHYCLIEHGLAITGPAEESQGGGILIANCAPEVSHSTIRSCRALNGGGIAIRFAQPMIQACVIEGNTADQDAGGIASDVSFARLEHCIIAGNSALWRAGGMYSGGASIDTLINCTIANNSAVQSGGGVYSGTIRILNSILWSNLAPSGPQIDGSTIVRFSNVQGGYPYPGDNIDTDPLFVDAANGDFHLQQGSPCIDTGDPNSPLDPDSTRADMGAFYFHHEPPCPPTEIPFIDNFDSPELDTCWSWIREDTSHWSLTERPGWMRIWTQEGHSWNNYCCWNNVLLQQIETQNFVCQTKLRFAPTQDNQEAGIVVFGDDDHHVRILRAHHSSFGNQAVFMDSEDGSSTIPYQNAMLTDTMVFFQILRIGDDFWGAYSADSISWSWFGPFGNSISSHDHLSLGVFATNGGQQVQSIPADFDYFRVDSLRGTNICGDVSGVWDSTGSPYYVTCDVTVPAGQTLEIQPGVEVLFTGHYKFNVFGNLQAIGTEQDSIVFTRAFPTEESKGRGIKIIAAQDTCRFRYCVIEHDSSYWTGEREQDGGAILSWNGSMLEIENCRFSHNFCADDGGAVLSYQTPYTVIRKSVFEFNRSSNQGGAIGAGGLEFADASGVIVSHCIFRSNYSSGGGALGILRSQTEVTNCTFTENDAPAGGSTLLCWDANVSLTNCIVWGEPSGFFSSVSGSITAHHSDIQGGYPGTGNIDADPLFVDAANGDFNLQAASPCINSGDPASSLDPDGSRADMGAFPYYQPPVCGTVTGVWPVNSAIKVACDLLVPDGDSLIIEPGVSVEFLGDYKLTVEGKLIAQGAATDSIRFWTDTLTNPARWSGIRFIQADSLSRLEYCLFEFGHVTGLADSGYGGAVYCLESSPTISHATFRHNTARNGGGLNLNINCNAVISNCSFEGNDALERGGALWIWDSAPVLTNCRFSDNSAITGGGAIRARQNVVLTLDNCEFVDNEGTTHGGALFASVLCSLDVQHSVFTGNHGTEGGAVAADTSFMQMQDCRFTENSARWGGAVNAKRMLPASEIQRTLFRSNHSIPLGTAGAGGAVALYSQPMTLRHCLLDSNTARLGGAIEVTLTQGNFDNCTVVNNSATVSGAVGYSWQGHHRYNSCILDGNSAATAFFLDGGSSTAEVRYSDWYQMPVSFANISALVGFGSLTATNVNGDSVDTYGNVFMDPQFGISEYDLQWNSPAINAGDPVFAPGADGTPADQGWKAYYQPSITVTPDSLDFGTLFYGEAAERFVTIINPSAVAAPLLDLYWNDAAFDADTPPDWLAAGDTLVLSVVFTPPMEGSYNDTLRLVSRLAGPDVLEIPMSAIVPLVPSAVDTLVITRGALNGTQLYWAPVSTTTSGQPFTPTYYVVWGSTEPDGPYTPFGVSTTTSYHHPFIINTQAKYFYYVTASDGSAVTGVKEYVKELENGE